MVFFVLETPLAAVVAAVTRRNKFNAPIEMVDVGDFVSGMGYCRRNGYIFSDLCSFINRKFNSLKLFCRYLVAVGICLTAARIRFLAARVG